MKVKETSTRQDFKSYSILEFTTFQQDYKNQIPLLVATNKHHGNRMGIRRSF